MLQVKKHTVRKSRTNNSADAEYNPSREARSSSGSDNGANDPQEARSSSGSDNGANDPQEERSSSGSDNGANDPQFDEHSPEESDESFSGQEEQQPTSVKTCRQLDLVAYPEAKKELEKLESFYTTEQNLRRKGVALKLETWRKLKIHILSK